MKKISVLLLTIDPEYGSALARSLQIHSNRFSVEMVQPGNARTGALEKGDYDLILTDDMGQPTPKTVYLTEDMATQRIQAEKWIFVVYKYQPAPLISKVLRMAHSVYSGTCMASDEAVRCNIMSVCSPSGGAGCTTIALGICQELQRFQGGEVLYLSLEEFESTTDYFPCSGLQSINITRYLYLLQNHDNAKNLDPQSCMCQDAYGVHAFQPARGRNPLRELDCEEFTKFINRITEKSWFAHIVIDCGNGFDDSVKAAMQLSGNICCLLGRNTLNNRIRSYIQHVAATSGVDPEEVIWIQNFCNAAADHCQMDEWDGKDECGSGVAWNRNIKHMIPADEDSISCKDGLKSISLDKKMGQGISRVVQGIQHLSGS